MFCSNCGKEIPDGSAFCINCGAKVDAELPAQPPVQQPPVQAPVNQQPYYQQPAGQQTYGQPYGQQPPYGQPPKNKFKLKPWMYIAGGAVVLLAIILVLVFTVFSGGMGPFKGNTTQTKFANDAVRVFAGAFEGLGNQDLKKLADQPFDINMDVDVDTGYYPVSASVEMAYDKEVLGVHAEAVDQDIIAQLDENILYISMYDQVGGIEFDTDADLSKPMPLKDRLEAVMEGISGGSEVSQADYIMVAEAMLNSINPECFGKKGDEWTLTMTPDDIVDMLKTLKEKADKNDKLADVLDELDMDVDDAIDNAEDMADYADFELNVTISYEGGKPVGLEMDYDDGSEYSSFNLQFGYEKTKNGRDISLTVKANGSEMNVDMSIVSKGKDIEFDGKAEYEGDIVRFEGSVTWDGSDVSGTVTVSMDGSEMSVDFDGTVAIGMPKEKVAEDSRFDLDKDEATVRDFEDVVGGYMFGGLGF